MFDFFPFIFRYHDSLNVYTWQMDLIWIELTIRNNFFYLSNANFSRSCNIRIEISGSFSKLYITFFICSPSFY
jgi:hypothetical protein